MPDKRIRLTMLNVMGGAEFPSALDTHVQWGVGLLDLKDCIFGKGIADLDGRELHDAKRLIDQRGLQTYCLSSVLFVGEVEQGEEFFTREYLGRLPRLIEIATVLRPRFIRLLAAQTARRGDFTDSTDYLRRSHPWVFDVYGRAIDLIHAAGFEATIENETHRCIWARPAEIVSFFNELARPQAVKLTWDIQNLWQCGTFPSLDVYRQLRPLIAFIHVKGGQGETPGGPLKWSSSLEDASWPVAEIIKEVAADGVSPVICLNPSHGSPRPGVDYSNVFKGDIDFLRLAIPEIE